MIGLYNHVIVFIIMFQQAIQDMINQLDNSNDMIGAFLEPSGDLKLADIPETMS